MTVILKYLKPICKNTTSNSSNSRQPKASLSEISGVILKMSMWLLCRSV